MRTLSHDCVNRSPKTKPSRSSMTTQSRNSLSPMMVSSSKYYLMKVSTSMELMDSTMTQAFCTSDDLIRLSNYPHSSIVLKWKCDIGTFCSYFGWDCL